MVMTLEEALELVVNEAEVSAIGESTDQNKLVLSACKMLRDHLKLINEIESENYEIL
jgi:hypothetical protein